MRYKIRTVTPVAEIPLLFDVDAAKEYLRVTGSAEDDTIEGLIAEAMGEVERFTGQVTTERVLELLQHGFPVLPELISLPRDPVTAIVSVKYTDPTSGSEVVLAEDGWRWSDSAPDQLLPPWRESWPSAACEAGSVRVVFEAGYGEGLCPPGLVSAVRKVLLQLYDCREEAALSDEVIRDLRSWRPLLA